MFKVRKLVAPAVLFAFCFAFSDVSLSETIIGYSANYHRVRFNGDFIDSNLFKKDNIGHEAFLRVKISEHMGLEYAYQHLRTEDYFLGISNQDWGVWFLTRFYMKGHSASLSFNSRKFDERITLFSNVGFISARMAFRIKLLSMGPSRYNGMIDVKHYKHFPKISVGAKYAISEDIAIRASYSAIRMNGLDKFSSKRGIINIIPQNPRKFLISCGIGIEKSF